MVSIQTRAHVGTDGRLDVELPAEYREKNVHVTIVVEGVDADASDKQEKRDVNGWPAEFFEQTAGAWQGEPLARSEQGAFEQREALK